MNLIERVDLETLKVIKEGFLKVYHKRDTMWLNVYCPKPKVQLSEEEYKELPSGQIPYEIEINDLDNPDRWGIDIGPDFVVGILAKEHFPEMIDFNTFVERDVRAFCWEYKMDIVVDSGESFHAYAWRERSPTETRKLICKMNLQDCVDLSHLYKSERYNHSCLRITDSRVSYKIRPAPVYIPKIKD